MYAGIFLNMEQVAKGFGYDSKTVRKERESIKGDFCFWMTEGGSMKPLKQCLTQKRKIMSLV